MRACKFHFVSTQVAAVLLTGALASTLALAADPALQGGAVRLAPPKPAAKLQMHLGTFEKKARLGDCVSIAADAIKDRGLRIFDRGHNVVIGGSDTLMVHAICAPDTTGKALEVTVTAISSDTKAAEEARNKIRENISKTVSFD